MNVQPNILRNAVEAKRQELISLLSSKYSGLSDGRRLQELTLTELQNIFRNVDNK